MDLRFCARGDRACWRSTSRAGRHGEKEFRPAPIRKECVLWKFAYGRGSRMVAFPEILWLWGVASTDLLRIWRIDFRFLFSLAGWLWRGSLFCLYVIIFV